MFKNPDQSPKIGWLVFQDGTQNRMETLDFFFFFLQSLQVGRGEGSDLYFTGFLFCFFLQSLQVEGKAQIYTSVCSALISSTANPPVL